MKKNINKVYKFEKQISLLEKVIEKRLKDHGIDSEEKRRDLSKKDFDELFKNEEMNSSLLLTSNLCKFFNLKKEDISEINNYEKNIKDLKNKNDKEVSKDLKFIIIDENNKKNTFQNCIPKEKKTISELEKESDSLKKKI